MWTERIAAQHEEIRAFCRRWKIREMSLFGSVLREDFRKDSDIDVLVEFEPDHGWGLYEVVDMKDELEALFGRKVDFVMKGGLRNPIRRREILANRQVVYAA
jgi:predicted nucleotidyltransferase